MASLSRFSRKLVWLVLGGCCLAPAQTTSASFQFEAIRPAPYTPAYLGNGALGLETNALATGASHCFLAGVYDQTAGDVPRIASAPAWNEIDIYNGSHWLNAEGATPQLENYRQMLDMYSGILQTSYVWVDDGRRISLHVEEFVSRDRADTAAIRITVTAETSGNLKIRLPLHNFAPPRRYMLGLLQKLDATAAHNPWLIWYPGHLDVSNTRLQLSPTDALLSLTAHAPGTAVNVGEAVALDLNGMAVSGSKDANGASANIELRAKAGVTYRFTKFAALIHSSAQSDPESDALRIAASARKTGWDAMLARHTAAWHRIWETDIIVDGDERLQRTIHSMLFYLLGSSREDLSVSTPPMGLSSGGYFGHIFWDAETFMFPPLLVLHPEMAHSYVDFRSRTLPAALANARQNHFSGAMYPWEANADGVESTPRFAGQNAKFENHINGDVALATWQYWLATGDHAWLQEKAWPILRATADFWVSRITWNAPLHRYEIGKVVAVDESKVGVSNDAYTNAIAQRNLELAAGAARVVGQTPDPKWSEVAAKMYLPDSDSSLLWFPLGRKFTDAQTRDAIQSMLGYIHRGDSGAMMHTEFYAILSAQLGDRQLMGQLIEPLWAPYLRPPFQAIAETPRNQNYNFITGAGAFLQQVLFGYTGLRLTERGLERRFPPLLPPGVHRLTLKNIAVRGKPQTLVFDSPSR